MYDRIRFYMAVEHASEGVKTSNKILFEVNLEYTLTNIS